MCGLAGFVAPVSENDAIAISQAMLDRLAHRGPDGSGRHLQDLGQNTRLGLIHTLLHIIGKPNEGMQPYHIENGILVFNGEIYNYQDLKLALSASGHEFKTSTDTEILAHGLASKGIAFLREVRGMFAFAFWDKRRRVLQIGRDPFGAKPLYWARLRRGICFASEYKAILPHLQEMPR